MALKCPCDGGSHLTKGREIHFTAEMAIRFAEDMEHFTKQPSLSCPWGAKYFNPLVEAVYQAKTEQASGLLDVERLDFKLHQALLFFNSAFNNAKNRVYQEHLERQREIELEKEHKSRLGNNY